MALSVRIPILRFVLGICLILLVVPSLPTAHAGPNVPSFAPSSSARRLEASSNALTRLLDYLRGKWSA